MCRPHLLLLQQLCSALFVRLFQFLSLSAEADSKKVKNNKKKNCVCVVPLKWNDTIQLKFTVISVE
jgi:hypothetical protein